MASSGMGCNLNIVVACGCHVNFVARENVSVSLGGKRVVHKIVEG